VFGTVLRSPPSPIRRPLVSNGETRRKWHGRKQTERPSIIHSSLYLPEPVYEALRKIAFDERLKIHDVVMEGIDAVLRRRGYPSVETLKAKRKR
jgi:hypothetical protein